MKPFFVALRRAWSVPLAAACLLAACAKEAPPPEPPRPVLTGVVGAVDAADAPVYAGEVRSRYETPLGFRIPGKIVARLVDAGAAVRAGEVLARLDAGDSALSVAAAEAQLTLAEAEARRFRELRARNFVSQAALDGKETTLKAARAQADLARNQGAYTVLRAEQDGVVAQVAAEVGQVVGAGQTVLRVARPDTLEVAIAIPESRRPGLRVGQVAEVSLWADGAARYAGVLRELAAVADPATRTYAARVGIRDADARVLLGMSAGVRLAGGRVDAGERFSVPLGAIFQQDGKPALWVVGADQTLALRPVEVAAYGEGTATLAGGVVAGERIVVAGVHKLAVGEKIRVAATGK